MQHIVNLLINTVTYKIFQAIECLRNELRNMLEYNGSWNAHFKFSKWIFSIKRIIMNRVLDLSYNARRLQSYNEAIFFLLQATLMCNGSMVCAGTLRKLGQEN